MYQTNTCIMWMIKEAITLASRQCEKIVKEIADGNVRALEKLYSVAGKAMFFVAHNVLGDYQLAEDAIQESLIKIMNGASGLTNMKAAYTWIITVTRNCALDILRKRKNEFPTGETAFFEVGTDNISETSIDMKNALAKQSKEEMCLSLDYYYDESECYLKDCISNNHDDFGEFEFYQIFLYLISVLM